MKLFCAKKLTFVHNYFRHYSGFLEDGTCFDDSNQRGQPVFFVLGAEQVLRGWEQVLPILSRGEKARIVLQPEVGHTTRSFHHLVFEADTKLYSV